MVTSPHPWLDHGTVVEASPGSCGRLVMRYALPAQVTEKTVCSPKKLDGASMRDGLVAVTGPGWGALPPSSTGVRSLALLRTCVNCGDSGRPPPSTVLGCGASAFRNGLRNWSPNELTFPPGP